MTDEEALLAAIIANPDEDTPRLVYADWLDDRAGESTPRAEFIRVQCRISKVRPRRSLAKADGVVYLPAMIGALLSCEMEAELVEYVQRDVSEDEWIDVLTPDGVIHSGFLITDVAAKKFGPWRVQVRSSGPPQHWPSDAEVVSQEEYDSLRKREGDLFGQHHYEWFSFDVEDLDKDLGPYAHGPRGKFVRGFVDAITCTAADWLQHADAICWCPEQTVACEICEGLNEAARVLGLPEEAPDPACGLCSGSGRIPRPCPLTAQPLRKVTLTTWPEGFGMHETAGRYQLPRGGSIQLRRNHGESDVSLACRLLAAEWPGIEFEMPRELEFL